MNVYLITYLFLGVLFSCFIAGSLLADDNKLKNNPIGWFLMLALVAATYPLWIIASWGYSSEKKSKVKK